VAQAYGIKPSCYWEVGEHFGNTVGTLREKKEKKKFTPLPKPKRKKKLAPLMHAEPSHWLHEIFIFSKLFVTNCGLG